VSGWQPIETAPKDGTWILCWSVTKDEEPKYPQRVKLWFWDQHRSRSRYTKYNPGGHGAWSYDDKILHQSSGEEYEPTHWMPLPEPPAPMLDLQAGPATRSIETHRLLPVIDGGASP
jgi:hypothetical protein